MSQYRRALVPGGTYFFTVVTYQRRPIFAEQEHRSILMDVIENVQRQVPFSVDAWVYLPDHLHCLWTLPQNDSDYSKRWGLIKAACTKRLRGIGERRGSLSGLRRRESTVWQRRFWEHLIRNEEDWQRHVDYIHYNPVKHGLVRHPREWVDSSFHSFVERRWYTRDWGGADGEWISEEFGE